MIELGELEGHHEEFKKRHTRVVAVSVEGPEEAKKTREEFPHLEVVADSRRQLVTAAGALHPGAGHDGEDTAAPTTFFIDQRGVVRSLYRPAHVFSGLSPEEVLATVDAKLAPAR
jgi:peroxiredoxin